MKFKSSLRAGLLLAVMLALNSPAAANDPPAAWDDHGGPPAAWCECPSGGVCVCAPTACPCPSPARKQAPQQQVQQYAYQPAVQQYQVDYPGPVYQFGQPVMYGQPMGGGCAGGMCAGGGCAGGACMPASRFGRRR